MGARPLVVGISLCGLLVGCGRTGLDRTAPRDHDAVPAESPPPLQDAAPPPPGDSSLPGCDADVTVTWPPGGPGAPATVRFGSVGFPEPRSVADVYFLVDVSLSMGSEIDTLRETLAELIDAIRCTDTDDGDCVDDLWTGVGVFVGERYDNLRAIQPDPAATRDALLEVSRDASAHEALFQSVACAADRTACPPEPTCAETGIGCAGFRPDAVRAIVVITDENDQCVDCAVTTAEAAVLSLRRSRVIFAGIDTGDRYTTRVDLTALAEGTGSFSRGGRVLYFHGDDERLGESIQSALGELAARVPRRVTATLGWPGDDLDIRAVTSRVEVNAEAPGCSTGGALEDTDGDGRPDAFASLLPDVPVCWDVVPRSPPVRPGRYRGRLVAAADGVPLVSRSLCFIVPAVR